ncbi:MAG: S1 RNA-binding domain-containing protein [Clostridiales bacterium]|jgi:S1 RNA binding domain protein|nr:S1 RNA-binding domain-containing protein [Clostridiales bacterium]
MNLVVGAILDGKVSGIMKFGAFVTLPGGRSGLVHISEIAHSYVNEVKDFLTEGQDVKVKIISIDDAGRINLSIKKAQEPSSAAVVSKPLDKTTNYRTASYRSAETTGSFRSPPADNTSFEDKLKQFLQESDSRIAGIKQYSNRRNPASRRSKGKQAGRQI